MNTIEELEQLIKQSRIISDLPEEETVDNSEIKVGDYVVLQKSYDNWNAEILKKGFLMVAIVGLIIIDIIEKLVI